MSVAAERIDDGGAAIDRLAVVAGVAMVLVDVVGVALLVDSLGVPESATYAVAAATAVVVGGSFLAVARSSGRRAADPDGKSTVARVTELIVSITVLSGVTVLLGYGGGTVLTLSAALGGPDPTTADGEPLGERLLTWAERNRAFMQSNGRGELPLTP